MVSMAKKQVAFGFRFDDVTKNSGICADYNKYFYIGLIIFYDTKTFEPA